MLNETEKTRVSASENAGRPVSDAACAAVPVEAQLIGDGVRDGLRIRRRARAAAEDAVVDGSEFVRHAVGDVSAAQITSNAYTRWNHQIYNLNSYEPVSLTQ